MILNFCEKHRKLTMDWIISNEDMQIVTFLEKGLMHLNRKQVLRLYSMGDKFLTRNKSKEKISLLFFQFFIPSRLSNPNAFRKATF